MKLPDQFNIQIYKTNDPEIIEIYCQIELFHSFTAVKREFFNNFPKEALEQAINNTKLYIKNQNA